MTSKELLLRDKKLSGQLAAVTNADWFAKALIYVWGEFTEYDATPEMLRGAKHFQKCLLTIATENPSTPEPLKTGLIHDLDHPRPTHETSTKTK